MSQPIPMSFTFRLAKTADAEFIIRLRNNPTLNQHIHATSQELDKQVKWLEDYKVRERAGNELFFIFFEDNKPVGTYRIVDINRFSFTIGSWVFDSHQNRSLPKLVDLMMSDFGFRELKLPIMLFEVRKANLRVIENQAQKFPVCYKEDSLGYYYLIFAEKWLLGKANYMSTYGIPSDLYEHHFDRIVDYYRNRKLEV